MKRFVPIDRFSGSVVRRIQNQGRFAARQRLHPGDDRQGYRYNHQVKYRRGNHGVESYPARIPSYPC